MIEIDRRLWRNFESLALYLANKRGYHLTEELPVGGRKWFDNDLICGLLYLSTAIWTPCTSTISVTVPILSYWQVVLKFEDIRFYNLSVYHYNLHDKQNCIITGYIMSERHNWWDIPWNWKNRYKSTGRAGNQKHFTNIPAIYGERTYIFLGMAGILL